MQRGLPIQLLIKHNVLIYFDQPTKTDVLNRLARSTASDGYLVLGAAETVIGLTDGFRMLPDKRGLYAVNTGAPRLSLAGAAKAAPRLVAINGGR